MTRSDKQRQRRRSLGSGVGSGLAERTYRLAFEVLEDRTMLDSGLPAAIVVGRTLATPATPTAASPNPTPTPAYFAGEVQGDKVIITYTVYNEQADPETGVLLTTTLEPGVTIDNNSPPSPPPAVSGQDLAWGLGTIQGYNRASVTLTVDLAGASTTQLDAGAHVSATLDAGAVSNNTPAATLRAGNVSDPGLLASTPDANTTDPFIQEEAAALGYDPTQIFDFLHTQLGYNSYLGSVRGARGTLWSGAGNALDVASLGVALMRASGIPAQYVQGTLTQAQAQALILSMFPPPLIVSGLVPAGATISDPADDPQLLAETEDHDWFQFDAGGGMQDADPLIAGATVGTSFTPAQVTFAEVPDALREKTTLTLTAEITTTASGLFGGLGGGGATTSTVLTHAFNDVDLVGRPLTVGNLVSSHTVSALIFSATTNTYSPYIEVGDYANPTIDDEFIRGTDYQETLTNLFGSQVLTGLFLNLTLSGPQGPSASYDRTLFDAIGYDARLHGGSSSLTINPAAGPSLSPLDLTTINALAGLFALHAVGPMLNEYAQVRQQIAAEAGTNAANAPATDAGALAVRDVVLMSRMLAANFLLASDLGTKADATAALVKAYFDRPRLVLVSSNVQAPQGTNPATLTFSIDLRRDTIRAIAYPGQNVAVVPSFNLVRGVGENVIESNVFGLTAPNNGSVLATVSTAAVFQQARAQKIPFVAISQANASLIDTLSIPAEAKDRISAAVVSGLVVVVPSRSVLINGAQTSAWYTINPSTGETIGVTQDGLNQGLVEYAATFTLAAVIYGTLTYIINFEVEPLGYEGYGNPADLKKAMSGVFAAEEVLALVFIAAAVIAVFLPGGLLFASLTFGLGGGVGLAAIASSLDPELPPFLVSPLPLDSLANLSGSGQVVIGVVPDPVFTVPAGSGLLPPVYRIGVKNQGQSDTKYQLSVAGLPVGFTALTSVPVIDVPAGQTGQVGLVLAPSGTLPPPGTTGSFNVTAKSATDPSVTTTQTISYTVNSVDDIVMTGGAPVVSTAPGAPVTDTLTIKNKGNVAETVTLTTNLSTGLSAGPLTPVGVAAGQSVTVPLVLTAASSTPLNSTLQAVVTASYGPAGAPLTQTLTVPVQVAIPGAAAIATAAQAAAANGDVALAPRLDDLSTALTDLVQNPAGPVAKGQTLASLDAVTGLLGADPFLASALPAFASARAAIVSAATPADVVAAANTLGTALGSLNTILTDEPAHQFTLSLVTNSQVARPQTPTTFQLVLQNTGSQATTYDLSASGLPAGVSAAFSQTRITLQPGQVTPGTTGVPPVTVTLTSSSTTGLSPFSFQVTATAEGAPEITQSTTGSLTARAALVQVVSVTPSPPFTQPGGKVDVSARILNAVNGQQQAEVSYTVTDPSSKVIFTSTPVATTLQVLTTLTTVDLGTLDTTGFAPGDDTINVTVADASGTPIPGATGTGALLIGTPVSATLSTTPATLPPGSGAVTTTLQIDSQSSFTAPLTLAGETAAGGADAVAVAGDLAYTGSSGGIDVADVADPTNPKVVSTFGTGDFPGMTVTALEVYQDELVVLAQDGGQTSQSLLIYSLADPSAPTLLGQTAITAQGDHLAHLGDLTVSNNHAFIGSFWYRYTVGSGQIFAQFGEDIDIDISNPADPAVVNVVYNNPPVASTGYPDGTSNVWQGAAVNSDVLLLASTTATGSTYLSGEQGLVMVVDTTDPSNPAVIEKLTIPGMGGVTGISVQGDRAFVIGSSNYWGSGTTGLAGNVVVATLDLTDPTSPTVISSQALDASATGISFVQSLGNNLYVTDAYNTSTSTGSLLVFDASDPQDVVVTQLKVPNNVGVNGFVASGGDLYTVDGSNLLVYNIGAATSTPVTARVTIPAEHGVSAVAGSFSLAPTSTTTNADGSQTLTWGLGLSASNPTQTITFNEAVAGLQPGQSLPVAQDGTVTFTSQGTTATLALPDQSVTGDQIIGLTPPTQTVAPGAAAGYTVNLTNPTTGAVTYDLSVQGVPADWVGLAPSVTIAAGGSMSVPLVLTSHPFAATGDDGFTVSASDAAGASASVQGTLVLRGPAVAPDTQSHGVVVSVSPTVGAAGQGTSATYVVQLTNTGSAADSFSLQVGGLPRGVAASFAQGTVEVLPGASQFVDVPLTLTPAPGTTPGLSPFTFTAVPSARPSAAGTAVGTLDVLSGGVSVGLSPSPGAPNSGFVLTVKNTGQAADTYDLALAGPVALVSKLGTDQVTLSPGASQVVAITTGPVGFAEAGALDLTATAMSHADPAVKGAATAALLIPTTVGFTSRLSPATQSLLRPGATTSLVTVNNTGNSEDQYEAMITGTKGPVTANLVGLDGLPTQAISLFRLPGLSAGAIQLQSSLSADGTGVVTIQVMSLSTHSIVNLAETVSTGPILTATQTQLSVSPVHPGTTGPVTLTATVSPAAATGDVVFTLDGVAIQKAAVPLKLVNGRAQATLTVPSLGVGSHTFQAFYTGASGVFLPSKSLVVPLVIKPITAADGPRVTNVWRLGYHWMPTTLVLGFNEALDPTRADNPAEYTIIGPGGHRIAVTSAVYDPASRTVTLHPSERLNLHWTYHLTVNGTAPYGLTDTQGNLLDGAGNGRPGSSYTTKVTMANWVLVLPPLLRSQAPVAKATLTPSLTLRTGPHPTGLLVSAKPTPAPAKSGARLATVMKALK